MSLGGEGLLSKSRELKKKKKKEDIISRFMEKELRDFSEFNLFLKNRLYWCLMS